jgi:GT2 family glycosyltransferase
MSTVTANVGREQVTTQTRDLRVTVVVPTFLRPTWLVGCLQSLAEQSRLPDEVIAVMRADDIGTRDAFEGFVASHQDCGMQFHAATVTEPGFLPPLIAGIEAATGDIVAFIDDDAAAYTDWVERLLGPYADPRVSGVGGRCVNIENGAEVQFSPAARVGKFRWYGSFIGNMYRDLTTNDSREVDFFAGGNMSYRRDALQAARIDFALAQDVAFHYEVDLGMQVKRAGGRLVYDPLAHIRHYSAPRAQAGMRKPDRETIFWYNHNSLYIAMKHSSGIRRWLAVLCSYAIGSTRAWGLLSASVGVMRNRSLQPLRELAPAFAGKARALRTLRERQARTSCEKQAGPA